MIEQLLAQVIAGPIPSNREYITTGGAVIIALITTLGAVIGPLLLSTRKEAKRATDAGHQAKRAAEEAGVLSKPTGNGFAADVKATLARIERDLGGIREEIRIERKERLLLASAISKIIERQD